MKTDTRFRLEDKRMHDLAMLSGILKRTPSEIVEELLDAAFPNHIVKKWQEEPPATVQALKPTVTWE